MSPRAVPTIAPTFSDTQASFTEHLKNYDAFGKSVAALGDLDQVM